MKRAGKFTKTLLVAAIVAALVILLCGPLVRFAGVPFRSVMAPLQFGTLAAGVIALLAIVAIIIDRRARRGTGLAVLALLIAGAPFLFMMSIVRTGANVPPIHDITTDTQDPPQFVEILPLRADAPNKAEYETAFTAQQLEAYPDIEPLRLQRAPEAAYGDAMAAVEEEGLELVASDPVAGRIEATATTAWFGFKDDVVIRVRPGDDGSSLVDVRSKSRMGMSDLGANAARIRNLLAEIRGD
ncbi:DUF1499 domain-containing protein [Pacificimonas sp. ICDLI1SI03]